MKSDKWYDLLSIETLDALALKTFGENPSSDFEQIEKYLHQGDKILEVGTGIGRIGIELIKNGFSYTGVENQSKFLKVFKEKLKHIKFNSKNIQLLNITFEELPENDKFDVILFSWSVIWDFSKKEQIKVLKKTYKLLSEKGVCLIDNPSKNQKYNKVELYEPTPFYYYDWKNLLSELGFSHKSTIYKTKTGVERELTILSK
jgi:ubiquinone/menaquinone biosynthesis C-methylase UbiE